MHLKYLYKRTVVGMTTPQCIEMAWILEKYTDTYSKSDSDLGRTGIIRHNIPTENARPIKQPLRRATVHMNYDIDAIIDDMLERDVKRPSLSPWASGIVMVRKNDGSLRFCVDYHKLKVKNFM